MRYAKTFEAGGYAGIILIQGATLPSLAGCILGNACELPPLSMTLMIWAGLLLFIFRSLYNRQILYIVSEGIGFFLQSALLLILLHKGI